MYILNKAILALGDTLTAGVINGTQAAYILNMFMSANENIISGVNMHEMLVNCMPREHYASLAIEPSVYVSNEVLNRNIYMMSLGNDFRGLNILDFDIITKAVLECKKSNKNGEYNYADSLMMFVRYAVTKDN